MAELRTEKLTISLTCVERDILEELCTYYGNDQGGVLRMALLELGRDAGITHESVRKKNAPKR